MDWELAGAQNLFVDGHYLNPERGWMMAKGFLRIQINFPKEVIS